MTSWPTSFAVLFRPEVALAAELDEVVEEADDARAPVVRNSTSSADAVIGSAGEPDATTR